MIALDLGTFRISQKLFRNKNVVHGPQCIRAKLLEFAHHSRLYLWGLLSFPTAAAFVQALILFCLGYGDSFLFPLIYPLVCSCQSDISTMHVWISSLPSFNCQGFPAACRMKSKLLFPAFWACCSQIPNCFSRQASTSVWSVP